jgi:hypothetical protein
MSYIPASWSPALNDHQALASLASQLPTSSHPPFPRPQTILPGRGKWPL